MVTGVEIRNGVGAPISNSAWTNAAVHPEAGGDNFT
jgi:hypothetical protein